MEICPRSRPVLADVERKRPDVLVFGGDVFSGPFPREVFECMISLGARVRPLLGNADRWLLDVYDGKAAPDQEDEWLIQQLPVDHREFFASLPRTLVLDVDGLGRVLFCHGSPRSEDEIVTVLTTAERLLPMLADVAERLVVCGHTHVQFDRKVDGFRVVNAGSVGMPYEDEPGARWALLGPQIELRRTPYDLDQAAARVAGSSRWGRREEFIRRYVLNRPSAAEASEYFEQLARDGHR
jgi:predicted phosphodiesterase